MSERPWIGELIRIGATLFLCLVGALGLSGSVYWAAVLLFCGLFVGLAVALALGVAFLVRGMIRWNR